ncbi:hypothetical protein H9Q09_01035 [Aurantimonas sp. DM33-3]|uniref:DUF3150 domain-containing protein n=1 Tax=Aurantimonas sp. DM33-3 TaxID=2766955 RepID=UPI001651C539|nr:DUF3150 domain-containing protein [Aurantimonas sp. DM33-3]MBC6714769.1 hypothetical protein [Aurantimonas sp. DM33-3]
MNAISPIRAATDSVASNTLAARAMIVTLSMSQWTGRRLDRQITDEVNSSHNAAADAGRYNKLLLDKTALDPIAKIANAARTEFNERTLPWLDGGSRIMSNQLYMQHAAWFRRVKGEFDAAVDAFIAEYPKHVADARVRLNGMFNLDDYPTVSEIRDKFSIDMKVMPVPSADDFRVSMSEAQAAEIRAEIEAHVQKATKTAVSDVYRRIAEVTGRMVERLNGYKPAKGKGDRSEGIFKDSLVENVRDLIGILPSLNITGDPELAAMADKLAPLAAYDAAVLRKDEGKRRDVAAEAAKILEDVSGFLA